MDREPTAPSEATRATEDLLRRSTENRMHIYVETLALVQSTERLRTLTEGRTT